MLANNFPAFVVKAKIEFKMLFGSKACGYELEIYVFV